jgi:hypothetical protein
LSAGRRRRRATAALELAQALAVVYRATAWARTMKWMLVVLVGGIAPVNTNLVFEKFADCLAAEEQMRRHYADALEAWDRGAAVNFQRRREYARARDLEAKRLLSNVGTCVPHGAGEQQPLATSSADSLQVFSAIIPHIAYQRHLKDAGRCRTSRDHQHDCNVGTSQHRFARDVLLDKLHGLG